jgi:hypothetical protein
MTSDRFRVVCLSLTIGVVFVLAWQAFTASRPAG